MKTLLGSIYAIAILIAIHALPELIIAFVPAWILVLAMFVGIAAIARLAVWAFAQAWKADN